MEPTNFGWLETKLDEKAIDHLWECVKNKKKSLKHSLVGQISASHSIEDKDNWFFDNIINEMLSKYGSTWGHDHTRIPCLKDFYPYLQDMWVNYQLKHEYNPIHDHSGLYSFVVWLNIPTEFNEQCLKPNSIDASSQYNSTFGFEYTDIFGKIRTYIYPQGKSWENTMLFFPSCMKHCVYPFYECDDARITISGNVWVTAND